MNPEELMKLARTNEDNCYRELTEILKKYGCEIHWRETNIDGQLADRGIFFRFNPQNLMRQDTNGG